MEPSSILTSLSACVIHPMYNKSKEGRRCRAGAWAVTASIGLADLLPDTTKQLLLQWIGRHAPGLATMAGNMPQHPSRICGARYTSSAIQRGAAGQQYRPAFQTRLKHCQALWRATCNGPCPERNATGTDGAIVQMKSHWCMSCIRRTP